jgi:hypothetical protein
MYENEKCKVRDAVESVGETSEQNRKPSVGQIVVGICRHGKRAAIITGVHSDTIVDLYILPFAVGYGGGAMHDTMYRAEFSTGGRFNSWHWVEAPQG